MPCPARINKPFLRALRCVGSFRRLCEYRQVRQTAVECRGWLREGGGDKCPCSSPLRAMFFERENPPRMKQSSGRKRERERERARERERERERESEREAEGISSGESPILQTDAGVHVIASLFATVAHIPDFCPVTTLPLPLVFDRGTIRNRTTVSVIKGGASGRAGEIPKGHGLNHFPTICILHECVSTTANYK